MMTDRAGSGRAPSACSAPDERAAKSRIDDLSGSSRWLALSPSPASPVSSPEPATPMYSPARQGLSLLRAPDCAGRTGSRSCPRANLGVSLLMRGLIVYPDRCECGGSVKQSSMDFRHLIDGAPVEDPAMSRGTTQQPNFALLFGLACLLIGIQVMAQFWADTASTLPDTDDA